LRQKKRYQKKNSRLHFRCYSGTAIRRRGSNSLRSNRSPLTCVWQHLRLRTYSEVGRPCGV